MTITLGEKPGTFAVIVCQKRTSHVTGTVKIPFLYHPRAVGVETYTIFTAVNIGPIHLKKIAFPSIESIEGNAIFSRSIAPKLTAVKIV